MSTQSLFRGACAFLLLLIGGTLGVQASGPIFSAYGLVQSAGTPVARRQTLNFVSGVTCVDNSGANRTDCTGGGVPPGLYTQNFTAQTSVTLTHNLGTTAVQVQCFDGSGGAGNKIYPNTEQSVDTNNYTVTFSIAQTGSCTVSGSSGSGGGGGSSLTVSSPYITDGTSYYAGLGPAAARVPGAFTFAWVNQRTITETITNGSPQWIVPDFGGGGPQLTARVATLTAGSNYTVSTCFTGFTTGNATAFLALSNGTGYLTWGVFSNASAASAFGFALFSWNNSTSLNSQVFATNVGSATGPVCLRVTDDGANRTYYAGAYTGAIQWVQFYQEARTTFLTATQWGYGSNYNNNINGVAQYNFLSATQVTP